MLWHKRVETRLLLMHRIVSATFALSVATYFTVLVLCTVVYISARKDTK